VSLFSLLLSRHRIWLDYDKTDTVTLDKFKIFLLRCGPFETCFGKVQGTTVEMINCSHGCRTDISISLQSDNVSLVFVRSDLYRRSAGSMVQVCGQRTSRAAGDDW